MIGTYRVMVLCILLQMISNVNIKFITHCILALSSSLQAPIFIAMTSYSSAEPTVLQLVPNAQYTNIGAYKLCSLAPENSLGLPNMDC